MKRQRKSFACPSKYATANEVHLFFLADEECPGVFGGQDGWWVYQHFRTTVRIQKLQNLR